MSNIISINQMIDYIEDFINDNMRLSTVIGGMVGSNIGRYVLDTVTDKYNIDKICIMEGCQDYMGFDKNTLTNHVFYGDIFYDMICDNPLNKDYDPFTINLYPNKMVYDTCINIEMLNKYDMLIINDTHLIPEFYYLSIINNFRGKIISIVDPFDIDGERFMSVYTVTDSLCKLSSMVTLARATYNVDTRFIDKHAKGYIHENNISIRSIGKIDDNQYITNNNDICSIVRSKQLQSKFRKNQKLLVTSNRVNTRTDNKTMKCISLPRNSIITIQSTALMNSLYMKFRLYSSKTIINDISVSYIAESDSINSIQVKPANILCLNESHFHRYKHTVLVIDDMPVTQREKYSILKNSLDLTVSHIK